jgi:serine/threonine-protein kinase
LIVLANCRELEGRTATAWAHYKEAAALARAEGRQANAKKAEELAAALERSLSKLRIDAEGMAAEMTVTLDGRPVAEAMLGVAMAVDPGEHRVAASARGHVGWSVDVTIPRGELHTLAVPPLQKEPSPPAPPIATRAGPARPSHGRVDRAPLKGAERRRAEPPAPPVSRPARVWPWISMGGGLVLAGAGVALHFNQREAGAILDKKCGADRRACPRDYDFNPDRGTELASFGGFVAGVALGAGGLGAGIIGLFTAPTRERAPSRAALWSAGAGVSPSGAFASVERRF